MNRINKITLLFSLFVASLAYSKVNKVETVQEFENLLNEKKLTIIKVSTSWCGPCKTIKPIFEELSQNHPDIIFIEVDGDNQATSSIKTKYHVSGYPTFIFLDKNGNVVDQFAGGSKDLLMRKTSSLISGNKSVCIPQATAIPQTEKVFQQGKNKQAEQQRKKISKEEKSMKKKQTYRPNSSRKRKKMTQAYM